MSFINYIVSYRSFVNQRSLFRQQYAMLINIVHRSLVYYGAEICAVVFGVSYIEHIHSTNKHIDHAIVDIGLYTYQTQGRATLPCALES